MKRTTLKILSLVFTVLIFTSFNKLYTFATEDTQIDDNVADSVSDSVNPEDAPRPENTYRYFFYLPEEWENKCSATAGIYWTEWTGHCAGLWPGYEANKTSVPGLFFYDVPKDVLAISWNNYVQGDILNEFADTSDELWQLTRCTDVFTCEYYDPGESENYPEGIENFDNMVYVVDPTDVDFYGFGGKELYDGEWFYYYGNGEYGFTPEKGEVYFNKRTFVMSEDKPTDPPPTSPAKEPYYTIYFENTYDWENVYIAWFSDDINENGGWPGEEMTCVKTDVQGHDIYTFEITHLADVIIFSNGNERTCDITENIGDRKMFYPVRKQYGDWLVGACDYMTENYELGDADLSGALNVRDATLVQKFVADLEVYDRNEFVVSDCDHDERLTVKDATYIQKLIAGLIKIPEI